VAGRFWLQSHAGRADYLAREPMSNFCNQTRSARDDAAPLGKRYMAVRRAAERYGWLSGASFQSVFRDLREQAGFHASQPNTPAIIHAAADLLDEARSGFLRSLRAFDRMRTSQKRAGRRTPARPELLALSRAVHLGSPSRRFPPVPGTTIPTPIPTPGAAPRHHSPPEFEAGTAVVVQLNARNRTARTGSVRAAMWHNKLARWTYYLDANGRRLSKRYFAEDLLPVTTEDLGPDKP
jgi:hypothetical protein